MTRHASLTIDSKNISVYDFLTLAQKMGLFQGTIKIAPESNHYSLEDIVAETHRHHEQANSVDKLFSSVLGDAVHHQVLKSIQKRSQVSSS